jgi:AraC-like DNA-binding protein
LCAEIVRRRQAYQQAEKQRRKTFLDQVLAENALPPHSLSQVARNLNCNVSILHDQFPETSRAIVNRNQAYKQEKKATIKAALQAALADQQNPPPPLIQLARQLGYENIDVLRIHFPDLCHQIHQRYQSSRQQIARAKLEAVLAASPDPPPTLKDISQQLGYSANGLKRLWPDLCQAIVEKRQQYQDGRKLALEQTLKAVLADEQTPPMSLKKIAAQFGFAPHTVGKYFPDLATAVSEKYKAYRSQKAQQRQQQLAEEVKSITRQLHHEGIDPTLKQLTLRLPYPKMIFMPYICEAWREARQELGLPT